MTRTLRKLLLLLTLVLVGEFCVNTNAYPADAKLSEYRLKALYLYNCAKFVEWPDETPDSSDIIKFCILGKKPLLEAFSTIGGKMVRGKKLVINQVTDLEDLPTSHILFISYSEKNKLAQILNRVKGKSVLIAGESEGFARSGGTINFIWKNGQLSFEINLDAAKRANIKLSSKLLMMAEIIKEKNIAEK